jgi:hypothetical protein
MTLVDAALGYQKLWTTHDLDRWMTEQQYVVWLHKIRGRQA